MFFININSILQVLCFWVTFGIYCVLIGSSFNRLFHILETINMDEEMDNMNNKLPALTRQITLPSSLVKHKRTHFFSQSMIFSRTLDCVGNIFFIDGQLNSILLVVDCGYH